MFLEDVSEMKNKCLPVSSLHSNSDLASFSEDYSKVLDEINHIGEILHVTKERYQKNRNELENQTKMIKSEHLKRSQNFGKLCFSPKAAQNYQHFQIYQPR